MPRLAPTDDPDRLALTFGEIAVAAGAAVMDIYGRDPHARLKRDRSPVCDADIASEALVTQQLRAAFGRLPIVAEEAASRGKRVAAGADFLLVDALDGTREFLSRNAEFTLKWELPNLTQEEQDAVFPLLRPSIEGNIDVNKYTNEDMIIIGEPDVCLEKILRYAEAGVDQLLCYCQFGDLPQR